MGIKKRLDDKSTEFGLWLREQEKFLPSKKEDIQLFLFKNEYKSYTDNGGKKSFDDWIKKDYEGLIKLFNTTNIDFIWSEYNETGLWMAIEEKRKNLSSHWAQDELFKLIDKAFMLSSFQYQGFHKLTFEETSPIDGRIYIDKKEINEKELIKFLRFEMPKSFYLTCYKENRNIISYDKIIMENKKLKDENNELKKDNNILKELI